MDTPEDYDRQQEYQNPNGYYNARKLLCHDTRIVMPKPTTAIDNWTTSVTKMAHSPPAAI
ncbi:hypothetical protein [Pedobacter sp. HMWF019]|uniref:hypothetical protein n=1 Tax=Pedobacter sp. HMWF019 TaxID=2056856 RepID=UPI001304D805|nr:hypothetical protein [Pedobacter sp. HMWF019]